MKTFFKICIVAMIAVVLSIFAFPNSANAASNGDLTYVLNDDGAGYTVSHCVPSAKGALEIPGSYKGKPITAIGESAFSFCTGLTSVVIPDGVTSIGTSAFYNCSGLKSVTLPEGLKTIGDRAFYYCYITSINIPEGVTDVGYSAFMYCFDLVSVTLPESVARIGASAFYQCESLKVVFYDGINKSDIEIDANNGMLTNAQWHTEVEESVFAEQECYYCKSCDNYYLLDGEYVYATVIFQNWDGTEIDRQLVKYNDIITVPNEPVRAHPQPNIYRYVFDGWDGGVTMICMENATYVATYKEVYRDYTVVFRNTDGTVLSSGTYHWEDPVTAPADPAKAPDKTYTYAFAGWDKAVENCTCDITYTATYDRTYINYTVSFKNWNGSVISEETYHYGQQVIAPADPTRAEDIAYTYAFAGWDEPVEYCKGNTIYTATFTPTYKDYIVEFQDCNGTVISTNTYHYGDTVIAPEPPVKEEDNTYTYVFLDWGKPIVSCEGNTTYVATYTPVFKEYTVIFKNLDGTKISSTTYHWGDMVEVPEAPAWHTDKDYAYTFAGWNKEITVCNGDKVYTATYKSWKFADVSTSGWQIGAVVYVCNNGLMSGKGTNEQGNIKFDPNSPITREEFVQVLYNAEGKPSVSIANKFPDVGNNVWFRNAVLWANQNNIANGLGNGNFGVGKNITRQDMAMMLFKYANMKNIVIRLNDGEIFRFADGSKVAIYAREAMEWAVTNGILSGKGTAGLPISTFHLDPAGTATRAECAAMLKNFMTAFGL